MSIKMMRNLLIKLLAFFLNLFLRFTCSFNKLSISRLDIFEKYAEEGNNIFAFWHNRLFYLVYYYVTHTEKRKISMLVSMSKDGDYGEALVHKLKQDVVRGSSSRGGQKAIRNLSAKAAAGNNIAITPDGPKGPAMRVNKGIIRLAQLTGSRIIPVSYQATHVWKLKSWDLFMVVKPFGKVHMAFADPMRIPRHLSPDEIEKYRKKLEDTLLELDLICARKLRLD
jgi:lysophospholipid acyltransferase (LPLAT)-like uncharacterized protein